MSNPYHSPSSLAVVERIRPAHRMRFLYIVALILLLSVVASMIEGYTRELPLVDQMVFFGRTAIGPFGALPMLSLGLTPQTLPFLVVACVVILMTFSYLVRPNNVSFMISIVGVTLWTLVPLVVNSLFRFGTRL